MIPPNHPIPLDTGVARVVARLDEDRYEWFAERAGILEFEARMPRIDAERQALIQTLARYGFPSSPPVWLVQVEVGGGTQWVLTVDEMVVRRQLTQYGVSGITVVDIADVLHRQFNDVAWLASSP